MRWMLAIAMVVVLAGYGCKGDEPATTPPAPNSSDTAPAEPARPSTPPPPPIEAAIERSKTEHRPLVVEFFTTWCKPCVVFEQTTLQDERVKAALSRIVFVRYDAEAAPGIAAAAKYNVSGYPTFLAIDTEGVARVTQDGLQGDGIQQFLSLIDAAEAATVDESEVRARLAAKPRDPAVRLWAARWFADRDRDAEALAQFDAVVADASASGADRATARGAALRLRRLAKWWADLVAEKLEIARLAPAAINAKDLAIATVESGAPIAQVRAVIAKVLDATTEPGALNELLYVALAAGATDEALAAAKRVLASSNDPSLLDTLAECYHVHGDKADALRVEDQALALADKDTGAALAPNRARFATGTGDSDEVIRVRAGVRQFAKRLADVEDPPSAASAASAAGGPDDGSSMQQAAMAAFTAARALANNVASACTSVAGTSEGAFANVALDAGGKVTSSTLFVEASATEALRSCLTKNLAGATLPIVPGMPPQAIEIRFKSDR
jgi:thioredoxin-like negative regulator of GroEL